jgi:hypothetical protein
MTDEQLEGLMLYALDRLKRFQELTEESIKNLKGEVK